MEVLQTVLFLLWINGLSQVLTIMPLWHLSPRDRWFNWPENLSPTRSRPVGQRCIDVTTAGGWWTNSAASSNSKLIARDILEKKKKSATYANHTVEIVIILIASTCFLRERAGKGEGWNFIIAEVTYKLFCGHCAAHHNVLEGQ